MRPLIVLGLLLAIALAGCRPAATEVTVAAIPSVKLARVPGGGVQPQVILDRKGALHLVFLRGEPGASNVFYAGREANADQWGNLRRVNSTPESAVSAGTVRGAQLALGRDGRPHVLWFGSDRAPKRADGEGAPLLYTRLKDDRSGFEAERNLMRRSHLLDGGAGITADPQGNVFVVWHAAVRPKGGEEDRRLFVARSTDDGRNFTAEAPISQPEHGACACCSVRTVISSSGALYSLFRSAEERVNRDVLLVHGQPGGTAWSTVRLDAWKVDACPMSSFALAETPEGLLAAWETSGEIRLARLDVTTGRPGPVTTPRQGGGNRRHPSLAVNGAGDVLLVWSEGTGWLRGGDLAWQQFDRQLQPQGEPEKIAGGIPVWGHPAAAARADGTFLIVH
jgi:hypothetical protein